MLPLSTILIFDFGIVPTVVFVFVFFSFFFIVTIVDKIDLDIELVIWAVLLYSVSVDQSCIFINKICTNNACDFPIHFRIEKE